MARPIITCTSCQRRRPRQAYGWCSGCHSRWLRAGRPDGGPPAHESVPTAAEAIRERVAEYQRLHDDGTADWEIAAQLGVSLRTVDRYRHQLGLTEPRTPRGDAMRTPERDAVRELDRLQRRPSTRRVGHDFTGKRDMSADVADLSPEHLATALGNVAKHSRDAAERDTFLEMLGLAPYASGDRGQYGNRRRPSRSGVAA